MTNSDAGMGLASEILGAIAREYGWPGFAPRVLVPLAISAETMREYAGRYALRGQALELTVAVEDGRLIGTQSGALPFELVPTGANVFTPVVDAPPFRFERDSLGRIATLVVGGARLERVP